MFDTVTGLKTRYDFEGNNPIPPPHHLLSLLNIGNAPIARDRQGRPVSCCSLEGLHALQAGFCCYCSEPMTLPETNRHRTTDAELSPLLAPSDVTREHILPKAHGGPGRLFNFAAACHACNNERSDMPLVIYLLAKRTDQVPHFRALHHSHKKAGLHAA